MRGQQSDSWNFDLAWISISRGVLLPRRQSKRGGRMRRTRYYALKRGCYFGVISSTLRWNTLMGGHERLNNYETMIFGFRKHLSVDQPSELQRIILQGIIFETSVKIVGTKERSSPRSLLSRWWRGVAVQFRKIDYVLTRVIHDSFSIYLCAKINGRENEKNLIHQFPNLNSHLIFQLSFLNFYSLK